MTTGSITSPKPGSAQQFAVREYTGEPADDLVAEYPLMPGKAIVAATDATLLIASPAAWSHDPERVLDTQGHPKHVHVEHAADMIGVDIDQRMVSARAAPMVPHESTAPGVVPRDSTLLRYGSPSGTAEPDAGEASRADRESWTLLGSDGKVAEPAERYQAPTAWASGDSVLSGL